MESLKQALQKCRNTLFCNICRYHEFKNKNFVNNLNIVGSLYVPKDSVYYVDEEGVMSVHSLAQFETYKVSN